MKEKKIYGNLIPIYDYFQEDNYLYIVMKYCRKGDLADYIEKYKRLTEIQAIQLLTQTLSGLNLLHNNGLLHRDIKPQNILIDDDDEYLICDFG